MFVRTSTVGLLDSGIGTQPEATALALGEREREGELLGWSN